MMTLWVQEMQQFLGKNIPGQVEAFTWEINQNPRYRLPSYQFNVGKSVWKKCSLI